MNMLGKSTCRRDGEIIEERLLGETNRAALLLDDPN
jgi:hypothetical protein